MRKVIKHLIFVGFVAFICLVFSCNSSKKKDGGLQKIVLIFDSIKANYDTLSFSTGGEMWTGEPILSAKLSAKTFMMYKIKDRLELEPEQEYLVFKHKYAPISSATYLLKQGDSLHIRYIDEVPFISSQDKRLKPYDLNYDYYKRKRFKLVDGMQLSEIIKNPTVLLMFRLAKGERGIEAKDILEEFRPQYQEELLSEALWLDSLYKEEQISTPNYSFYKERNKYQTLSMKLNPQNQEHIFSELGAYNNSLYMNDSYGFYKNYYWQVAQLYIANVFALNNSSLTSTYDYLEQDTVLRAELAQEMREVILNNILANRPISERIKYFAKFVNSVSDTALISRLSKQYEYALDSTMAASKDLILLSPKGEKTSLSELIRECQGKVCYLDFWASWCAPCLSEMPDSFKLRESKTYDNDVVFIYLSIDSKKETWLKSFKKAQLEDYRYNYLILNFKDSEFAKQHKITSIPRYMLFDKWGGLINSNAPRPSSQTLTDYFDEALLK